MSLAGLAHYAGKNAARFLIALALAVLTIAGQGAAQNPDTMMPDASAAKAKQILADMIAAFGGPAYLNARQSECAGRMSQFGHNADLTAYLPFKSYWEFPDKNRTDIGKKGNVIDLYAGYEGWTLDHDGVGPEPSAQVDNFRAQLPNNPHYIFRYRLKEEGMNFRWAGLDLIDLKQVDWVELSDSKQRVYRIAVARDTHLMVRFVVLTPNEANSQPDEDITSYANYHSLDGVQTPLQVSRTHNGRRVFQAFYDMCRYNPNLPANFFTKAGLEERFREVGSRSDKKKAAKARDE
jgi:hypothetical protein